MVVSATGKILASHNPEVNFTPASIFKVITALQSLETLGPIYRFPTYFFLTEELDLYIVGTGDPLLISEYIQSIITALQKAGLKQIRHILIDNSSYDLSKITINQSISTNPYDTALSAVGVNFNTIQVEITKENKIISGEPQTPTLPIMQDKGRGLASGIHRINLGTNRHDLALYAGQLFAAALIEANIEITGQIKIGKKPTQTRLIHTYYSPELQELLPAMLLYSNNYMANQIYLKNGVKEFGYPATWDKAQKSMELFLQSHHLRDSIKIKDGAGLSKENALNCRTMTGVLEKFRKYSHLLPFKNNIPLKSGTMTGVYSYAGYLGRGKDAPTFVIILNQEKNNRDALLEKLLELYGTFLRENDEK